MCGRFSLATTPELIADHFALTTAPVFEAHFNIVPSQDILTIGIRADGSRGAANLRWGLVPAWARDPKVGNKLANARGETLADKPSFRESFRQRRCIVPMDGFYEWQSSDGSKQPHYIHMRDGTPFGVAALWDIWKGPEARSLHTVCLITTAANALMGKVHHRMPVILHPRDYALWLDRGIRSPDQLQGLLKPFDPEPMQAHPVSKRVNKPDQDDSELRTPLADAAASSASIAS